MKSVTREREREREYSQYFNPHTREECDVFDPADNSIHTYDFNPHTREECDSTEAYQGLQPPDFNPHTREECDFVSGGGACTLEISIHTPVKSVTY